MPKPKKESKVSLFSRIFYFFPIQIVLLHFRKNFLVLLYWAFLFSIVTEAIGSKYGLPNLLLYPEYLNHAGVLAHLILGFSVGGFIMSYNIANYIVNGPAFSFIATLAKPFNKFTLNSSLIPLLFLATHTYKIIDYQYHKELIGAFEISTNVFSYLLGVSFFIILTMTYFLNTNVSALNIFNQRISDRKNFVRQFFFKNLEWYGKNYELKDSRVETYISSFRKISRARDGVHYKKDVLEKVFAQNHINASFFQFLVLVSIFIFGSLREHPFLLIPAGASLVLIFTLFLMISGAIYTWIRGWSGLVIIALFILLNYISQYPDFNYRNYPYGLDLQPKVAYNNEVINALSIDEIQFKKDSLSAIFSLESWKKRYVQKHKKLPYIVLLSTSGGGLRSAFWSFKNMLLLDSLTNDKFTEQTFFISGSSGGMIGASFYRELYLQENDGIIASRYLPEFEKQITQDILNSLTSTLVLHDLFYRNQKYDYQGVSYRKDRAASFEKQLNQNTEFVFNKPFDTHANLEKNGKIPWLIFSPAISNDGRRLIICNQNASYLCYQKNYRPHHDLISENVEYKKLFANNNPMQIKMSSLLRMNASFPYILPTVSLPTEPEINVMDAGVRDNYGIRNSVQFALIFEKWIKENTKGILLIQLNDIQDDILIKSNPLSSIVNQITQPAHGFYGNTLVIQKYMAEQLHQNLKRNYGDKMAYYKIEFEQVIEDRISLSFHLTEVEKKRIRKGLHSEKNKIQYLEIQQLLNE